MQTRKRFGQHFLRDPAVIEAIVQAINPLPDQSVIEIGPGPGAITLPMLRRCQRLTAIELDRDIVPGLIKSMASAGELTVHQADALKFDFATLRASPEAPLLRLTGNLPYNISTPLLFHLLGFHTHILDMHFMLQKEVVRRMAATPGDKTYGRLTVMLAQRCRISSLFDIAPSAFTPPPKVDSSVVRIDVRRDPAFTVDDPLMFDRLVRQAFSMRRKTLRNGLRGLLDSEGIEALGIDPGIRPERLLPEQFASLANAASTILSDTPPTP